MTGTSEAAPRSLHVVGLAGWLVLIGLALAWEGLGLAFAREGWPSMSDLMRSVSRPVVGRWVLLALWLWLGWHLFVRGWQPLLRGLPPARGPATAALTFGQLIRQVVVPLLCTYAAFVLAMLVRSRPTSGPSGRPAATEARPGLWRLARHVAFTLTAGYAAFLLVVVLCYAVVADQTPEFLRAAVSGGAFITFAVALPGLLLFSRMETLVRRGSNQ
jgi:Family of unknown function (DUF6256)/Family of unknown function (DUF6186)